MPGCPNSTASGCRCPEHEPGLSEHAADPVAYAAALRRLQPTRLHVVTAGDPLERPCSGTLTCACKRCLAERADRMATGSTDRAQPWQPRPARHRRAA